MEPYDFLLVTLIIVMIGMEIRQRLTASVVQQLADLVYELSDRMRDYEYNDSNPKTKWIKPPELKDVQAPTE